MSIPIHKHSAIKRFFILLFSQKVFGLLVAVDLIQPCFLGLFIDQSRVFLHLGVGGDHLSGDRAINIGCDFDALDDEGCLSGFQILPDGWELDMYDLSEFCLGMVRNANSCDSFLREKLKPLMALGVFLSCIGGKAYFQRTCGERTRIS